MIGKKQAGMSRLYVMSVREVYSRSTSSDEGRGKHFDPVLIDRIPTTADVSLG